jgi:CRP/FNR family cyclic AMP-dependent transcriptional regulator
MPHTDKIDPKIAREYLAKSRLSAELGEDALDVLSQHVRTRLVQTDEFLIEAGHMDDSLHILVSGKLEVIAPSLGSEPVTLAVLTPGDLAGEMSFVDGAAHAVGLRALVPCEVISLTRGDLEAMLETHPRVVYEVMRTIVRAAHHIVRKMNLQHVEMTRYFYKSSGRY